MRKRLPVRLLRALEKHDLKIIRRIEATVLQELAADSFGISRCYFGSIYSPEQCMIMSNVDSGIIEGILGGGHICFSEHITEGCGRCKACLKSQL